MLLLAALLPASGPAEAPVAAATLFPVADIVGRVAGPAWRIVQVLPAGASPHTFEPTPAVVRALQPARLVFKIGVVDDWIDPLAASLRRARIVRLDANINRLSTPVVSSGPHHGHGEYDPHYWLSAANGALMASAAANALAEADPGRAAAYRANGRALAAELRELHAELRLTLAPVAGSRVIVFHDAWRYFAAAYGLEIAAVFQSSPGREPTPRDLKRLYEQARLHRARVLFSEPQLPGDSLEPLLADLGLRLVALDPIGGAGPGDSYAGMLRRNARAILQALERRP